MRESEITKTKKRRKREIPLCSHGSGIKKGLTAAVKKAKRGEGSNINVMVSGKKLFQNPFFNGGEEGQLKQTRDGGSWGENERKEGESKGRGGGGGVYTEGYSVSSGKKRGCA